MIGWGSGTAGGRGSALEGGFRTNRLLEGRVQEQRADLGACDLKTPLAQRFQGWGIALPYCTALLETHERLLKVGCALLSQHEALLFSTDLGTGSLCTALG